MSTRFRILRQRGEIYGLAWRTLSRCLKHYGKVLIKVSRLKEKYNQVSHLYEIVVTKKKETKLAESVTFTKRALHEDRCLPAGGYVLRTSHTDWSVEEVAKTYWRLTEIESTFRVMKSDLGLRPLYHSRDDRIEGHMMITVLADHVAHLVRTKLKKVDLCHSWDTIRTELNEVKRITTLLPRSQTRALVVKVDENLTPLLEQIFQAMGYQYNLDATRTKKRVQKDKKRSSKTTRLVNLVHPHIIVVRTNSRWSRPRYAKFGQRGAKYAIQPEGNWNISWQKPP